MSAKIGVFIDEDYANFLRYKYYFITDHINHVLLLV